MVTNDGLKTDVPLVIVSLGVRTGAYKREVSSVFEVTIELRD